MATSRTLVTAKDLLARPDDGLFCELVEGRLITMSPPGFGHGLCGGRLHVALSLFVRRRRLGLVLPQGTGFRLKSDPDTVRAPDVAFVSTVRIQPGPVPSSYWDGAPDLAVEVLSPGERRLDVEAKVREYLACGARAVWVVRPRTRTVSIHHADEPGVTFAEQDTLEDPVVLPGFKYRLRQLFEDLPRT
jgi:Uma2 family endonuclease